MLQEEGFSSSNLKAFIYIYIVSGMGGERSPCRPGKEGREGRSSLRWVV